MSEMINHVKVLFCTAPNYHFPPFTLCSAHLHPTFTIWTLPSGVQNEIHCRLSYFAHLKLKAGVDFILSTSSWTANEY